MHEYVAVDPDGAEIEIPKELFVALEDFMKTRKSPGSITIYFREGEIACVEAVAKKPIVIPDSPCSCIKRRPTSIKCSLVFTATSPDWERGIHVKLLPPRMME